MNLGIIFLISFLYLVLLFLIANTVENNYTRFEKWINNPYTYTLSLAVYCSAWTFYGSVGGASQNGILFLSIYLGPTIAAFLFIPFYQKIIRLKQQTGFSSFADFIALHFGRSIWLGALITMLCIISVVPYIALQLKSLTDIIVLVQHYQQPTAPATHISNNFYQSISIYIALALSFFIMVYGFRTIDAGEKRNGMIGAIAFESIIKLLSFLLVGFFSVRLAADFVQQPLQSPYNAHLLSADTFWDTHTQTDWLANICLSFLAFLFLPRQFQVGVVENKNEKHLRKASWLFPLYLLLINLFVLPIALYGNALLHSQQIHPDNFVIALPLALHQPVLASIAYLGGFSAATSMIIVETIALNIMLSNNIILPLLIWIRQKSGILQNKNLDYIILNVRRFGVLLIMTAAFYYETMLNTGSSLINIGLTSFVAIAQFAPLSLAAIYSKQTSALAAYGSLAVGFGSWFFFLILPYFEATHLLHTHISTQGLWGLHYLSSANFLGISGYAPTTTAFFWSLLFNSLTFIILSVCFEPKTTTTLQLDLFQKATLDEMQHKGNMKELMQIMEHFLGKDRLNAVVTSYQKSQTTALPQQFASSHFIQYCQRILSSVLGVSSARLLFKNFDKNGGADIPEDVIQVLTEKQNIKLMNKELVRNQEALKRATVQLQEANEKMKKIDAAKDEFLHTITHELRTPLTSIRALSEIVLDNPHLEAEERQHFIQVVVKEAERLSHLINQVLRLEKIESEMYRLNYSVFDFSQLIKEATEALEGIITQKQATLNYTPLPTACNIEADKDLLMQVLQNLLSNAIKHNHQAQPLIAVRLLDKDTYWECSISDNGPGIDPQVGNAIFDKYLQVRSTVKKNKPEGSGLGLAITKKIIELHRGKIDYYNNPEIGLTFFFTIPKQQQPSSTLSNLQQQPI